MSVPSTLMAVLKFALTLLDPIHAVAMLDIDWQPINAHAMVCIASSTIIITLILVKLTISWNIVNVNFILVSRMIVNPCKCL